MNSIASDNSDYEAQYIRRIGTASCYRTKSHFKAKEKYLSSHKLSSDFLRNERNSPTPCNITTNRRSSPFRNTRSRSPRRHSSRVSGLQRKLLAASSGMKPEIDQCSGKDRRSLRSTIVEKGSAAEEDRNGAVMTATAAADDVVVNAVVKTALPSVLSSVPVISQVPPPVVSAVLTTVATGTERTDDFGKANDTGDADTDTDTDTDACQPVAIPSPSLSSPTQRNSITSPLTPSLTPHGHRQMQPLPSLTPTPTRPHLVNSAHTIVNVACEQVRDWSRPRN